MTRKFLALLAALLLCTLPVLAEVTGVPAAEEPCDVACPTAEDILGRWEIVYFVVNAAGRTNPPGDAYIIITEDAMLFYNNADLYDECTYELVGDLLQMNRTGPSLQWVGEDVMLFRDKNNPTTLGVLQRTASPDNPFRGDWEVVLCYNGGKPIEPNTTMVTFTDVTVEWDPSDSDDRVVLPAVYQDGRCTFGSQSAVIDASGAMIVTGSSEVVILLPIVY